MTTEELRQRAEAIDYNFDEQLFDGMPSQLIAVVEDQWGQAHAALAREAINAGLAAPSQTEEWFRQRVARRRTTGDPITRIW